MQTPLAFQPAYIIQQQQHQPSPQPPLVLATQHLQGLSQSLDALQKSLHNYDNSKYSAVQEQSAAYFNRLQGFDRMLQKPQPTSTGLNGSQLPQAIAIPQYIERLNNVESIKDTVQSELNEGPIQKAQVARGLQSNFKMFREEMKAISDERGLRVVKQDEVNPQLIDGFMGLEESMGLSLGGFDLNGGVSMEGFGMMMNGVMDINMVDQQQQL